MNSKTESYTKILFNKSRLLAPAVLAALFYLIPACSDSGDPISPGNGGGGGAANQPPALSAIGRQYVAANNLLSVTISATDAESTPTFSITGEPAGASFTDNLNGTATFSWTPAPSDAGIASVTFVASDDSSVTVNEVVSIEVITHTYANYIEPLFRNSCDKFGCHDMASSQSGFSAQMYSTVLAGGNTGPGISLGDTAASIIFQKLLNPPPFGTRMPQDGGPNFFDAFPGRIDSIATWILARAPEN